MHKSFKRFNLTFLAIIIVSFSHIIMLLFLTSLATRSPLLGFFVFFSQLKQDDSDLSWYFLLRDVKLMKYGGVRQELVENDASSPNLWPRVTHDIVPHHYWQAAGITESLFNLLMTEERFFKKGGIHKFMLMFQSDICFSNFIPK